MVNLWFLLFNLEVEREDYEMALGPHTRVVAFSLKDEMDEVLTGVCEQLEISKSRYIQNVIGQSLDDWSMMAKFGVTPRRVAAARDYLKRRWHVEVSEPGEKARRSGLGKVSEDGKRKRGSSASVRSRGHSRVENPVRG